MNKKLELKFSLLETSRLQLLEILDKTDKNKLNTPHGKDRWSVAQVIHHLNNAENLSTIYVSKKMLDVTNHKNPSAYARFKLLFLKVAFLLPFRYKAPAFLGEMPDVDYTDIRLKWEETRKRLRALLNTIPDDMLKKNIFLQPVAGRLNIYEMIDFMQAHFNRHKKQIEAVLQ